MAPRLRGLAEAPGSTWRCGPSNFFRVAYFQRGRQIERFELGSDDLRQSGVRDIAANCWYAVRIAGGMLDKIKYIAVYQTNPVSLIYALPRGRKVTPHLLMPSRF